MLRQLTAATQAQPQQSVDAAGQPDAASTVDELDEAGSSLDEATEDIAGHGVDDLQQDSASSISSSGLQAALARHHHHQLPATALSTAWVSQLQKSGLVGALMAAAYPDRIAQLKAGSGGKPDYTLSSGDDTHHTAMHICSLPALLCSWLDRYNVAVWNKQQVCTDIRLILPDPLEAYVCCRCMCSRSCCEPSSCLRPSGWQPVHCCC